MTMHESIAATGTTPTPSRVNDAATGWNMAAAIWSAKLRNIMEKKGFIDEKGRIKKPLNVVGVNPQTSRNWVIGTDAPRTLEEHNSALAALDLLNATLPNTVAARNELQAMFKDLQANLAGAPERAEFASHVQRTIANGSRHINGGGHHNRPNPINDHPAISKRLHHDESVAYAELGKTKLLDILSSTENPHEYLAAARALAGTSAADRDHHLDAFGASWEYGDALPSRENLESLSEHFGKLQTYAGDYDRLKHLVINARLERIRDESQSSKQIGKQFAEMPKEYWRSAIDECMYGDGFANQQSENAILWQDKVVPIAHKGEYVRAMRGLLGKAPEDVASFDGQTPNARSLTSILAFESQNYQIAGVSSDGLISDIMSYFEQAQKKNPQEPAFYDRNTMLSLPYEHKHKTHQQALAERQETTTRSR